MEISDRSSSSSFSASNESSYEEFHFPTDQIMPGLFPYYAAAGGSVFPNASSTGGSSCVGTTTIAEDPPKDEPTPTVRYNQEGTCCAIHPQIQLREKGWFGRFKTIRSSCPLCDEWHALQMKKIRMEVELLQQQLSRYHPPQELTLPPEWRKKQSDNIMHNNMDRFDLETTRVNKIENAPILSEPKALDIHHPLMEEAEEDIEDADITDTNTVLRRQLRRLQHNPYPSRVLEICHQWRIQCEKSSAFCRSIVLNDGMDVLLDAMILQKDHHEIQEAVCRILGLLVHDNHLHKDWLAESDGIAVILSAMERFPEEADLQEAACGALHSYVYDHEPSQALLAHSRGVSLLMAAMALHRSDPGVQELGCAALTNMACHSDTSILQAIVQSGGLEAVLCAMRAHPTDEGVQEVGCAALSNLIYHGSDDQMSEALQAQTEEIDVVISAMNRYPSSSGVQEHGCRAIVALSHHHDVNKLCLVESGALQSVCRAMRQHSWDELVLKAATEALSSLSYCQGHIQTIIGLETDSLSRILLIINNHSTKTDLMAVCCTCLHNLVRHHPHNQRLLARFGGIPAILRVMKANAEDASEDRCCPALQQQGCHIIELLLCLPVARLALTNTASNPVGEMIDTLLQATMTCCCGSIGQTDIATSVSRILRMLISCNVGDKEGLTQKYDLRPYSCDSQQGGEREQTVGAIDYDTQIFFEDQPMPIDSSSTFSLGLCASSAYPNATVPVATRGLMA